ncbi:MAG: NUDIX domain-containing protein [Candidatus Omnitrophica bacterium]|nr:NUDIX domain-containing protein [Candidatus Omnitrophota bacterium]
MKKELEVVAALIKKKKRLFLCKRKTDDRYGGLWEFPGGCIEKGETPEMAIVRELKEEVGLNVRPKDLVFKVDDEDESLIIHLTLIACVVEGGIARPIDCAELGFFNFAEIVSLDIAPVDKKIIEYLKDNDPTG